MPGIEKITRFADEYEVGRDRRRLTQSERELLTNALEDYLCHEQWHEPATDDAVAISSIDAALAAGDGDEHVSQLAAARSLIVDLASRLERRDDANLIMREHLAMMSETVRRLKDQLVALKDGRVVLG